MTTNDYWSLTEKERAALSGEDMERLEPFELMRNGTLEPGEPPPRPTEGVDAPSLPTVTLYRPKLEHYGTLDVAFPDVESVQAFLDLNPHRVESKWMEGETVEFAGLMRLDLNNVEAIALPLRETVEAKESELESVARKLRAWKSDRAEWDKLAGAAKQALEAMYDDWRRCREERQEHQRILDTARRYLDLSDGNVEQAGRYLRDAFDPVAIREAFEFFDETGFSPERWGVQLEAATVAEGPAPESPEDVLP